MNRAYFARSLRKTEILYKSHLKKLKIHLKEKYIPVEALTIAAIMGQRVIGIYGNMTKVV